MLDIRMIRENPEKVNELLKRRNPELSIDGILEIDAKRRKVQTQADALMEVASGTSDAAVIDSLMAAAMVGEGTGYANLTYTIGLNTEEYGVGFRKGSDLTEALNDFFVESYEDGSMMECAEKYGVQAAIIEQK